MNGLDAHLSHQLAQYQATIDANQEPEEYTPTHKEKAFMRAYSHNVAMATLDNVLYFLEHKEDPPEDTPWWWVSVEDAYLVWLDAIQYARSAA